MTPILNLGQLRAATAGMPDSTEVRYLAHWGQAEDLVLVTVEDLPPDLKASLDAAMLYFDAYPEHIKSH